MKQEYGTLVEWGGGNRGAGRGGKKPVSVPLVQTSSRKDWNGIELGTPR